MNCGIRINNVLAFALVISALALFRPAGATEVAGVKLDDTARVANQELRLNGAGVRYKVMFKVYAAALYLSEKKNALPELLALPGAKRVAIVMLRDVSSEDFGQAFMTGMRKNSDINERAKIVNQMQLFGQLFASIPELKKGDAMTIDWIPGAGTQLQLNGKKIAEIIPDVAFYNALLKIWLGQSPVDEKLKRLMLGEKPDETVRSSSY